MKVEFKVKPVTRYVVTKYTAEEQINETTFRSASSEVCGEFDNYKKANIVCEALSKTLAIELEGTGDYDISCDTYDAPQGSK